MQAALPPRRAGERCALGRRQTTSISTSSQATGNAVQSDVGLSDSRLVIRTGLGATVRLPRQNDMGRVFSGGALGALVAQAHRIDSGKKVLAPTQKHGRDDEVDLVDQPCSEILPNGRNAAAESHILAVSGLLCSLERRMDAIGHEAKSCIS